jgi:hypothetical protein
MFFFVLGDKRIPPRDVPPVTEAPPVAPVSRSSSSLSLSSAAGRTEDDEDTRDVNGNANGLVTDFNL